MAPRFGVEEDEEEPIGIVYVGGNENETVVVLAAVVVGKNEEGKVIETTWRILVRILLGLIIADVFLTIFGGDNRIKGVVRLLNGNERSEPSQ